MYSLVTGEQVDLGSVSPLAGYPRQLDTEALVCTCACKRGGSESQWDYLRVLKGTSKSFTLSHWPRVEEGWAGSPLELSTERQGALEK